MSYVDSDEKRKPWTHLTFILESAEDLASRLDKEILKTPKISSRQHDQKRTALVELFQLMIGNNDYSTTRSPPNKDCCHNVELIKPVNLQSDIVPVPYDFDASGLVNADYAVPPDILPIDNVRKRYFRGRCRTPEIWAETIAVFRDNREEILALFENSAQLGDYLRKKNLEYIRDFYDIIEDPGRFKSQVIRRCDG